MNIINVDPARAASTNIFYSTLLVRDMTLDPAVKPFGNLTLRPFSPQCPGRLYPQQHSPALQPTAVWSLGI
jgi:hypothetical protein